MAEKSLEEVRRWKEEVAKEFNGLSFGEIQEHLRKNTEEVIKKYNLNLKVVESSDENKKAI
jgi:hypothetical protein